MRDIKFRQYIPRTKAFHYWGLIKEGVFVGPLQKRFAKDSEQYTGLKDRNGKEIYAGDIVKIENHWSKKTALIQPVEYRRASFQPFDDSDWGWDETECEVIGNIYEDSELLE